MRYSEIMNEVVGHSPDIRRRIRELDAEFSDREGLIQIMYGRGATDAELEAEHLEAARLENQRLRAEIAQIHAEIAAEDDPLEDALTRAKIDKVRAEAAAKLADL